MTPRQRCAMRSGRRGVGYRPRVTFDSAGVTLCSHRVTLCSSGVTPFSPHVTPDLPHVTLFASHVTLHVTPALDNRFIHTNEVLP
jgi:hypothetical protein